MKISRRTIRSLTRKIPVLRFEDQALTSFSGLVAFQALFEKLGLPELLRRAFAHLRSSRAYSPHRMYLLLTIHLILGWKRLRDLDYYRDDPLVRRAVGWSRLPSVSAVSRALSGFDERAYEAARRLSRELVIARVLKEGLATITLDFDGSVQRTKGRRKEGTAIGYGCRKGRRSYYPFFGTIAQTGQVLDVLHRAGNVHDTNGALGLIAGNCTELRESGYRGRLEARFDNAHFNERTCLWLQEAQIEFVGSVPFEAIPQLKSLIEMRGRWRRIDEDTAFFEKIWKPAKWSSSMRFLFYRQRRGTPRKGPIQLDFFEPSSKHYEYKVLVTSKQTGAANVLAFYNGRGTSEGIFAELKSQSGMDCMPSCTLIGNKMYLLASVQAHNLNRELHMQTSERRTRRASPKRPALWSFDQIGSFRKRIVQRAGRLTRPRGVLTLTMSANRRVAEELSGIIHRLSSAT